MNSKFSELFGSVIMLFSLITVVIIAGCGGNGGKNRMALQSKIDSLQNEIKNLKEAKTLSEANIKRWDSLDMMAFNNKDMKMTNHFYDKDVVMNMNDGNQMKGYDNVEKDMKKFFENWPDMKTESQILKIGDGEWTAGIDHVTGTFTKPMTMGKKTIQPNNKKISMNFVTFARWKNGKIVEEYDFGNDEIFMKQLGLEKN